MTDFKAKMHQIRFRLGLCPRPHWGSLQRSRQGEGLGWGRGGKGGREGGGSGGEGKVGPQVTVELGPLRALLRHWPGLQRTPASNFWDMRPRNMTNNSSQILIIDQTR